jgi:hypothetical protein
MSILESNSERASYAFKKYVVLSKFGAPVEIHLLIIALIHNTILK